MKAERQGNTVNRRLECKSAICILAPESPLTSYVILAKSPFLTELDFFNQQNKNKQNYSPPKLLLA